MAKASAIKSSATANNDIREQIFKSFIAESNKQGVPIFDLGENADRVKVQVVPTGALTVDVALSAGGVPRGRIIEIFGPEASGKTGLAFSIGGEAQRLGGYVAFIDAEHAFNPTYATAMGLDLSRTAFYSPTSGEDAFNIARACCRSKAFDVVIVDSVAGLATKAEINGELGEGARMAPIASLMSVGLRVLTPVAEESNTMVIFINQLRLNPGQMMGNPEYTPGGKSLKFFASVRLEVRSPNGNKKEVDKVLIGQTCNIKVVKNKVGPPGRSTEYDMFFETGIDRDATVIAVGKQMGIVENKGAFYYYKGENVGQGLDKFKAWLKANPEALEDIKNQVYGRLNGVIESTEVSADDLDSAMAAAAELKDDVMSQAVAQVSLPGGDNAYGAEYEEYETDGEEQPDI